MAGESFVHEVVTGIVTVAATVIGWLYKDNSRRLGKLEDCNFHLKNQLREKYITVPDCDRIHQATSQAAAQMLTRMDQGFERIHERIDQLQKDGHERHERLRDLIDERTRK